MLRKLVFCCVEETEHNIIIILLVRYGGVTDDESVFVARIVAMPETALCAREGRESATINNLGPED